MSKKPLQLTGVERVFDLNEVIVSKTDLRGRITYANDVFQRLAGYAEAELIGQPHSILRHPDMPRCVFKLLWDTIASGRELFAYIVNRAKNGDHYWVFAHVTPTWDEAGSIVGYHSNRRLPRREAVARIVELYAALRAEEARHDNPKEGMEAASRLVAATLETIGVPYDEFIFSL